MAELLKFHEGIKIQKKYQEPVREFVKVALEKYGDRIESIILFGSVARGEAMEDSDIDILVVGDVSLEELVDISFPILLEYGELISTKNMKKERLEYLAREGYSFMRNVMKEGVVLYERMGEAFGESRREAEVNQYLV
jgi:predicted nucleotidyltransferase